MEPPRPLWQPIGLSRHVAAGAVVLALAALVYGNSLRAPLIFDNAAIILQDSRIRAATAENVSLIFTQDYWWPRYVTGNYRPLVTLSYLVNYTVLGNAGSSLGYHLVNLALHWANGVLVYMLVLALVGAFWPALWAGALFVTHPIATEAVTNVVGRADLMATTAVLGGLLLHAKAAQVRGGRAVLLLCGLGVTTAAGVLCKESAVALLGVVAAWDVVHARRDGVRAGSYVALVLPLVGLAVLRAGLATNLNPRMQLFGDNPLFGAGFLAARATAIKVIGKELWLLCWPRWLSCDYSYDEIPLVAWGAGGWENAKAVVALAAVTALVAVAVRRWRSDPAVSFLVAFFFLTLLPIANVVIFIGSIMAERFLYLPSVAFAGAVAIAAFRLCRAAIPRPAPAVAGALLGVLALAYGARAARRNVDWQDGVRLWSTAVRAAPRSFRTHHALGAALFDADAPEHANVDDAIREGETALAIVDATPLPPLYQPAAVPANLGTYYWTKAELLAARGADAEERARWYERAAATLARAADLADVEDQAYAARRVAAGLTADDPHRIGSASVYRHLGLAYVRLGRYPDALDAFTRERRLHPDDAEVYRNFAQAYVASGDRERAAVALLQAFAIAGPAQVVPALLQLYADVEGGECAATTADHGAAINLQCPLVHAHACRAYGELERIFLAAKLEPSASHVKDQAIRYLACAPDTFE